MGSKLFSNYALKLVPKTPQGYNGCPSAPYPKKAARFQNEPTSMRCFPFRLRRSHYLWPLQPLPRTAQEARQKVQSSERYLISSLEVILLQLKATLSCCDQ